MPTADQVQLSSHLKKVIQGLEHVNSKCSRSCCPLFPLDHYFFCVEGKRDLRTLLDGKTHKAVSSSDAVQTVRMVRPFVGTF